MSGLHYEVVSVANLRDKQHRRMFDIFRQYYESVTFERFLEDLSVKDDVIVLLDERNVIQGFSTMKNLAVVVQGKRVNGLFSGDTVVTREYWGQRVLGRAFLKYLFLQRAKQPFAPYYWFLISKGYKTYLLMANNFDEYYPNVAREMSGWDKGVLDAFGAALYPDAYDAKTGLISFPESHGQVRVGVAAITQELRNRYPKIAFFEEKNPNWADGTELACIARMTWTMPLKYALKARFKRTPSESRDVAASADAAAAAVRSTT